eukprot:scaffold2045_cov404-Prasinococcus_capsulatus_cf.AAC.63
MSDDDSHAPTATMVSSAATPTPNPSVSDRTFCKKSSLEASAGSIPHSRVRRAPARNPHADETAIGLRRCVGATGWLVFTSLVRKSARILCRLGTGNKHAFPAT